MIATATTTKNSPLGDRLDDTPRFYAINRTGTSTGRRTRNAPTADAGGRLLLFLDVQPFGRRGIAIGGILGVFGLSRVGVAGGLLLRNSVTHGFHLKAVVQYRAIRRQVGSRSAIIIRGVLHARSAIASDEPGRKKPERTLGTAIRWYRPRLPKEVLAELNRKSDLKAFGQTVGYLLTISLTGSLFVDACLRRPWLAPLALLLHGAWCAFLINGFHELVHDSVFKTRYLNRFFLRIFSFLGWYNHVGFWASHSEHHRFTLHPPDDLEVVLPQQVTLRAILSFGVVDWKGLTWVIPNTLRSAFNQLSGKWETYLFTERKPELRSALHGWARIVLVGHGVIAVFSVLSGYWPVLIAVSFGRFFGAGLQFLCNATQHIGLTDEYPDFRVCCRTFALDPVLSFLYWNMNYHTEHHMFAGVPCYNLPRLHRLIRSEMPECTPGLIQTWRQISEILRRQHEDPTYQFWPELPAVSDAG